MEVTMAFDPLCELIEAQDKRLAKGEEVIKRLRQVNEYTRNILAGCPIGLDKIHCQNCAFQKEGLCDFPHRVEG